MKSLFMETTQIPAERTTGQIQEILGRNGAYQVAAEFEAGEVRAIKFSILVNDREIPFSLPCRWEAIFSTLQERGRGKRHTRRSKGQDDLRIQAKRIAWRQILRWVEAQMALTETNMVKLQEVFMPYAITHSGKTLYESLESNNFMAIENKKME